MGSPTTLSKREWLRPCGGGSDHQGSPEKHSLGGSPPQDHPKRGLLPPRRPKSQHTRAACALHVLCACMLRALHVRCTCKTCALHTHYMFIIGALRAQCTCTACALHVHYTCIKHITHARITRALPSHFACSTHVHFPCVAHALRVPRAPHVHYTCAARTLRVHYDVQYTCSAPHAHFTWMTRTFSVHCTRAAPA